MNNLCNGFNTLRLKSSIEQQNDQCNIVSSLEDIFKQQNSSFDSDDEQILIQQVLLRGGGCCSTTPIMPETRIRFLQFPQTFASNLKQYTNVIVDKASQFHDRYHQDDVLCAILWFQNHKEHIQKLCINQALNLQHYDLIERTLENLIKQLVIYLKVSGYIFHLLLQICNDLLRVIFYYQQINESRYMQEELQLKLKEYISELEEQISVESNKIWLTGAEFELQMIKICIEHLRTNSKTSENLMKAVLFGIATSLTQLKPSEELLDALMEAGKYLLLNFYDKQIKHPLKIYELYYFFENLKWQIIFQLKEGYSVQQTISQLVEGYNKYIGISQSWLIHFCWINLLSGLISYRPIISKLYVEQKYTSKINWNQLIAQNLIVALPYDKSRGKIKYTGRGLYIIQEFQNLKLFQEYLISEQVNSFRLLPLYLNFEFDSQAQNKINIQDLSISLLTKMDDLELISSLNNLLKSCHSQIIENFNQINTQTSKDIINQLDNKLTLKVCKQDLKYLVDQQKEQLLQLLYILYEIDFIRIKEMEIMNNIEQILKQNEQNLISIKDKMQFQMRPNFEEIRFESENKLIKKFQQIPQLLFHICQILSSYEVFIDQINFQGETKTFQNENLRTYQQEFETFILFFNEYISNFICQMKIIKSFIIKVNLEIKLIITQEKISQQEISEQLILFYNSNLIKNLSSYFSVQSKDQIGKNWDFTVLSDFNNNIKRCCEFQIIFKFYKKLLKIQQLKVNGLKNEDKIKNIYFNSKTSLSNTSDSNNEALDLIQNLVIETKVMIQGYFDKYPNLIMSKQEQAELNVIENKIRDDISSLQKQKCNQELKIQTILILQQALNKLTQIGLNRINKQTLKEEININFTKSLITLNSKIQGNNEKSEQLESVTKYGNLDLDSQLFLNFENVIFQLNAINTNMKRLKKVIQQNYNLFSWSAEIWDSNKRDEFKESIKNIVAEIDEQFQDVCKSIQTEQQYVMNSSKLQSLSNNKCFDKMQFNLTFLDNQYLFKIDTSQSDQNGICCQIYQELIQNLIKSTTVDAQKANILSEIFGDSSHKVREAVAYNIIKIDAQIQESKIKEYCQNLLQKVWIYEKHSDVRNILKNKEMIEMQKQLFSNDLTTMQNQIKAEMKHMLNKIEQLENSVLIDNSIESKDQLKQALEDFETYFDNITDMSQKLDISMIFLKEISKDIKHIKSSIDQILSNVSGIANDLRKLRGKHYFELLLIRKEYILKQKDENDLDQIHIELKTQEYDPITGKKKQIQNIDVTSYLIKKTYNDFKGEINEFLWDENEKMKDVMLLKGRAGSGKSRAAKNIEELLWSFDQIEPKWIPIYVSLPSLKDPKHNLIDQALESENYNFDNLQIKEFKEAVKQKNLNVVLIFESYDEMKQDCLEQNLYNTNRLVQEFNLTDSRQNLKIIITTRQEILNSIEYQTWFNGKSISTLKEVELLPFNQNQSDEYLLSYSKISVKRCIKRFYEFLKQLKAQSFSYDEFKSIWNYIQETIQKILSKNKNEQLLFQQDDTEKIIQKIQRIQFFQHFQADQMISLQKDLLQLWGFQKFSQTIQKVKIQHLLNTPFMLEIIVYVLPQMSSYFNSTHFMRQVLKKNYIKLKQEANKSSNLLQIYKKINQGQNQIQSDIQNSKATDETYLIQLYDQIQQDLDDQNFFEQNSIANNFTYLDNLIINEKQVSFQVKFDANFVVSAFQLHQFTAFDFYKRFVEYYHAQQIQKWKELGKNLNQHSFLIDLEYFCTYLAIEMTLRELTQINYKQKGKLKLLPDTQDNQETSWEDHYFNENEVDSEYKSQLRKCMLINSKGSLFSFNHKSIQEFFVADYIFRLFEKIFIKKDELDEKLLRKSLFCNRDKFNISLEHFSGCLELLKPKLFQFDKIKEKLLEIIKLQNKYPQSKEELVRLSSNSIYILSFLGVFLGEEDLSGIQISDTKLTGLSFFKSNLSYTKFENVSIDSCNFTQAKIENSNWNNLICKEIASVIGHKNQVNSIVFIGDGMKLISSSDDGTIIWWDIINNQLISETYFYHPILKLSYSQTDNTFACLTNDEIFLLNEWYQKNSSYQTLINYDDQDIFLSSNRKYLAVENYKNTVSIIEIENLKKQNEQPNNETFQCTSFIKCMVLSQDQNLLITGGQEVQLWDVIDLSNVRMIASVPTNLKNTSCVLFSKNCTIIVIGNEDGIIEIWKILDLKNFDLIQTIKLNENIEKIEFSKNDKLLIIKTLSKLYQYDCYELVTQFGCVKLIEQYDTSLLIKQQYLKKVDLDSCVKEVEINPTNTILACSEEKNKKYKLSIWNINDQKSIIYNSTLIDNQDEIYRLKFSQQGEILLSCIFNIIFVWDFKNLNLIKKIETNHKKIIDFAFSSDLKTLVSCSSNQVEIDYEFLIQGERERNKLPISKNLNCKGIQFLQEILLVNGEINDQSVLQFWDIKELQLNFEQILKIKVNYFQFFAEGLVMLTFGDKGYAWDRNELNFFQKQSGSSFNKIKWTKITFSADDDHDFLLLFDGQNIHLIENYFDQDDSDESMFETIYTSDIQISISFSLDSYLIAISLNDGIELIFVDAFLQFHQDCQKVNDFSISDDSSLLVLATNKGMRLKNLETNKEIFYTLDQKYLSVCFIQESEKIVLVTESSLYLFNIGDPQNPIIFYNIVFFGNKIQQVYKMEDSKQVMILYEKFIAIHELKEMGCANLIQIQKQNTLSKNCILKSNSKYVGIGVDNEFQFIDLSNSIQINLIYNVVSQLQKVFYKSFSQSNQNFFVIGLDQESRISTIKIDIINQEVQINRGEILEDSKIRFINSNHKQDKLIIAYYIPNLSQEKLEMLDFESLKVSQSFEQFQFNDYDFGELYNCQNASFSEDNQYFITYYVDQTIKLWDSKTCKLLSVFKTNTYRTDLVCISKKEFLAQSCFKDIKLWNLKALRQQQFEMDGHSDSINSIQLSPDGLQLVSGSKGQIIRWELTKFSKIDVLLQGSNLPSIFYFSDDSNYFAAVDESGHIIIWKLTTLLLINYYKKICCTWIPTSFKFNVFDNQLISCHNINGQQFNIVWNLNKSSLYDGKKNILHTNIEPLDKFFSKDKTLLIKTKPIQIIDLENRQQSNLFYQFNNTLPKSDEKIVEVSHNKLKIAIQYENEIILWSFESKKIQHRFATENRPSQNLAFSRNDKILFSNQDARIKCFDTDQNTIIKEIQIQIPHDKENIKFQYLKCFPVKNDNFLFVYCYTESLKKTYIFASFIENHQESWILYQWNYSVVHIQSAYCDEKQLLAIQTFRYFGLYDVRLKNCIAILEPTVFDNFNTNLLTFSQAGNYLLFIGNSKTINLLDLTNLDKIKLKLNQKQQTNCEDIIGFQIQQDEQTIKIIGKNENIIFDNISNYTEYYELYQGDIKATQIIQKSYNFIMNGQDDILQLTNLQSGKIFKLDQLKKLISCATFTPCGQNLILGIKDGSIQIYKLDSNNEPKCFKSFAQNPLILADSCSIKQSNFFNQENVSLQQLFLQKYAYTQ